MEDNLLEQDQVVANQLWLVAKATLEHHYDFYAN